MLSRLASWSGLNSTLVNNLPFVRAFPVSVSMVTELIRGRLYASSGTNAEIGGFREIYVTSLRVFSQGENVLEWPFIAMIQRSKSSRRIGTHSRGPCVDITVVVIIGGTDKRQDFLYLHKYFLREHGEVHYRSVRGCCFDMSLLNAIACLEGIEYAKYVEDEINYETNRVSVKNLGRMKDILYELNRVSTVRLQTQTILKTQKERFREDEIKWLSEWAIGIWVVRLVQQGIVDHCVAIDTMNALIYDSYE
eukprot:IDg2239t1